MAGKLYVTMQNDTYSSARQGGVANVIHRKGCAVPGIIYKVRRGGGWRVFNIDGKPGIANYRGRAVRVRVNRRFIRT